MRELSLHSHFYQHESMSAISPFFALQASAMLENDNSVGAIALCNKGIEAYPDYATAYIILAKSFLSRNDYMGALVALQRGVQRLPLDKNITKLHEEIQNSPFWNQRTLDIPEVKPETEVKPEKGNEPIIVEVAEKLKAEEISTNYETPKEQNAKSIEIKPESELQTKEAEKMQDLFDKAQNIVATAKSQSGGKPILSEPQPTLPKPISHLRIIESAEIMRDTSSPWRSKNVRLIPGLEFTPLRFESHIVPTRERAYSIPEPPPFPNIHIPEPEKLVSAFPIETDVDKLIRSAVYGEMQSKITPLEELAKRLQSVRILAVEDTDEPTIPLLPVEPSATITPIVTETIAKIYEKQGAYKAALQAYQHLVESNHENADEFEKKIQELQSKI